VRRKGSHAWDGWIADSSQEISSQTDRELVSRRLNPRRIALSWETMRHALAVLLTLLVGVLAHPASTAARMTGASGRCSIADAGRTSRGVDDARRASVLRGRAVIVSDDRGEEPDNPEPTLAPARTSIPSQRWAVSVAPADVAASPIAWRLASGGPRGPPAQR